MAALAIPVAWEAPAEATKHAKRHRKRPLRVRAATEQDVAAISRLNQQFKLDLPDFKWTDRAWIRAEVHHGNYFVLHQGKKTLGAMCLLTSPEPGKSAYVETIATARSGHGKGYGKRLIAFAAKKARRAGSSDLNVESFCSYGVKDFYLRAGFKVLPKVGRVDSGEPYYRFRMRLNPPRSRSL